MNWKTTGATAALFFGLSNSAAQAAPADASGYMLADRASRHVYVRPHSGGWEYRRPRAGGWDWDVDVYVGPRTPLFYQRWNPYVECPEDDKTPEREKYLQKQIERKDREIRMLREGERKEDTKRIENLEKEVEKLRRQLNEKPEYLAPLPPAPVLTEPYVLAPETSCLTDREKTRLVYEALLNADVFETVRLDDNIHTKRKNKQVDIGTVPLWAYDNESGQYVISGIFDIGQYYELSQKLRGTDAEPNLHVIVVPEHAKNEEIRKIVADRLKEWNILK